MKRKSGMKAVQIGLMALVMTVLLSMPALAASQEVEEVIAQLERMQQVDINPAWPPDIEANEALVQQMLDDYLQCTDQQRAEFTQEQQDDLRAYFTVLYDIQGRNVGEVDLLFTQEPQTPGAAQPESSAAQEDEPSDSSLAEAAVSSQQGAESAEAATSGESEAASQGASSMADSQSDSTAASSMAESQSAASQTAASSEATAVPLPTDEQNGSGRALGTLGLIVLVGIAAVLFIRFIIALRQAGKAPQSVEEARAQELFGENYRSANVLGELAQKPQQEQKESEKGVASAQTQADAKKAELQDDEQEAAQQSEEPKRFRPVWLGTKKEKEKPQPPVQELSEEIEEEPMQEPQNADGDMNAEAYLQQPEPFAPAAGSFARPAPLGEEISPPQGTAANTAAAPAATEAARATIGPNPDNPNSIAMRSFSQSPRNGRPGKMSFRQGDPDDLDGVDE